MAAVLLYCRCRRILPIVGDDNVVVNDWEKELGGEDFFDDDDVATPAQEESIGVE